MQLSTARKQWAAYVALNGEDVRTPTMRGRGATTTRLQVLTGSVEAGNRSKTISREIMTLSDELLNAKKISKAQHKQIYDRYVS
jgi:hypothetical protein